MASKCFTQARSIWYLKSGPESITITLPSASNKTEVRRRLSCLSVDVHTSQSQAITGTPCEVPVPKNVMVTAAVGFVLSDAKMQPVFRQAIYNLFPSFVQALPRR